MQNVISRQRCNALTLAAIVIFAIVTLSSTAAVGAQGHAAPDPDLLQRNVSSTQTLEGWLHVTYADPKPGSGNAVQIFIELATPDGQSYPLAAPVGQVQPFAGDYVQVTLPALPDGVANLPGSDQTYTLLSLQTLADPYGLEAANAFEGQWDWVNILCRFGDVSNITPAQPSYFEQLMRYSKPGMADYWPQTSYGKNTTNASSVYGWYNLPGPREDYIIRNPDNSIAGFDADKFAEDCSAAADPDIDFTLVEGINFHYNVEPYSGTSALGGSDSLRVDGNASLRSFRMTWMPPWGWQSLGVMAHEMGHAYGWPHSNADSLNDSPNPWPYDNAYDVMSLAQACFQNVQQAGFGCEQIGTIGYHLRMNNWITAAQTLAIASGSEQSVTINALTAANPNDYPLLIEVDGGSSAAYLTVEARTWDNYDANLWGEGVLIHGIVPGRTEPAKLIDATPDNSFPYADSGSVWVPGETYTDDPSGLSIEVLSRSGDAYTLRINNGFGIVLPERRYDADNTDVFTYAGNWTVEAGEYVSDDPNASVTFEVVSSKEIELFASGAYSIDGLSGGAGVASAAGARPATLDAAHNSQTVPLGREQRWTLTLSPENGTLRFAGVYASNLEQIAVSNEAEFISALQTANSDGLGNRIVMAPGTYSFGPPNLANFSRLPMIEDEGNVIDLEIDGQGASITGTSLDASLFEIGSGANVFMKNLTLQNSSAAVVGSVIYNRGDLTLDNVSVANNSASLGSIAAFGPLTIRNSTFDGNTATAGGGYAGAVLASGGGTLEIENSTFVGNSADFGGAILSSVASEIVNTTFYANVANFGGAYYQASFGGANETATFRHSTFKANVASNNAAIQADASVRVQATLFDDTVNSCGTYGGGSIASLGDNIAKSGCSALTATNDLQNTDPLLAALADNGGPTQTSAISAGSPAESHVTGTCFISSDQRGEARPASGCDAGAYEYNNPSEPDVDGDGYVTALDAIRVINSMGGSYAETLDVNGDGSITNQDILLVLQALGSVLVD